MSEYLSSHVLNNPVRHATNQIQSSACGKAIIVGEHAAVYGAHAAAMPLPSLRFDLNVLIEPAAGTRSHFIHLELAGQEVSRKIQAVILEAIRLLQLPPLTLQGKSCTTVPIGAGLGSSATLCVSVMRALAQYAGLTLSPSELARLSNELEKIFHGNPSGLDASVVAMEACILFAKSKTLANIVTKQPDSGCWDFVLVDSQLRAATANMIQIAEPYFRGSRGDRHIQHFDDLSLATSRALGEGDAHAVGEAMNSCDSYLREAGVVPHKLVTMIEQLKGCGVLGAKTTGAGGGGMLLALLDPRYAHEQTIAIQRQLSGHTVLPVRLP